jgi:hypothetical protein
MGETLQYRPMYLCLWSICKPMSDSTYPSVAAPINLSPPRHLFKTERSLLLPFIQNIQLRQDIMGKLSLNAWFMVFFGRAALFFPLLCTVHTVL